MSENTDARPSGDMKNRPMNRTFSDSDREQIRSARDRLNEVLAIPDVHSCRPKDETVELAIGELQDVISEKQEATTNVQ